MIIKESSPSVVEAEESTSFEIHVTLVLKKLPQFNFKAVWRSTSLSSGVSKNCFNCVKLSSYYDQSFQLSHKSILFSKIRFYKGKFKGCFKYLYLKNFILM